MNNSFELNKQNIGEKVELKGWINKSRRMGELIFFDIRNGKKIVQVVSNSNSETFVVAKKLKKEYVVCVFGEVTKRKDINKDIDSGEIEIIASKIEIISKSIQTPLIINDKTDALELKRLEYRYLDLRRNINQEMLIKRSKLNRLIRDFFYKNNFIEVETPIITKPTPGGSGEFKVFSNNHKGKYYSLVQSPQIYKQLLMYGGISKYFQIAKCFRDEDSRSDRQIEFTQLDLEISFTNKSEIKQLINNLIKKIVFEFKNLKIDKIKSIKYKDSINKYGTDKPDLRFDNEIYDITKLLNETPINFIKDLIKINMKAKSIFFEGNISNKEIKDLENLLKSQGCSGLSWAKIENNSITGSLKHLSNKNIIDIKNKMNIKNNGVLFMIIDKEYKSLEFMGRVRNIVAQKLNLKDDNKLSFVWIDDFPMFEKNNEGEIESVHNPFTSVKEEQLNLFKKINKNEIEKLLSLESNAYDIVLNGFEIGGGAIRISNKEEQIKVFEILGLSESEINLSFGWFLESQEYGIPNHGGIALGIDRILSILLNKDSIRDVIAFPKTSKGTDEMMKSPIKLK